MTIAFGAAELELKPSSTAGQSLVACTHASNLSMGRSKLDSKVSPLAHDRRKTFDALLAGFERDEIICHYQPQFDAVTLELSGLEALVRWERDGIGLIMPHQFLDVAKDTGILSRIDDLVLRRVLRDIGRWQSAGINVPPISVNVSADRLNDNTLADQLRALDIPEGVLNFELLESTFLDTMSPVVNRNLDVARNLGIAIEIDDFGSGHASIAGLLAVSPSKLKIGSTLVSPITSSERQRKLVEKIIEIAHTLEIRVVAEGVETIEHIENLQAMQCDFLQGFGLSRPLTGSATDLFLAADASRALSDF